MNELERILYGYYTAGEIIGFFIRLWMLIFAGLLVAAMIVWHDLVFEVIFEGIGELISAMLPFLVLWWIISLIFRRVFR